MAAPILVMGGRGAGNRINDNFCASAAKLLDPKIFYFWDNPYFAEIAPIGTRTMAQSIVDFKKHADLRLAERPFWMGIGYSLGFAALGDFVGELSLSRCLGIGGFSDPRRHESQYMGTRVPEGPGIAGNRKIGRGKYPVWSYTAPRDPISELRKGAGLRVIGSGVGAPADGRKPGPAEYLAAFRDPKLPGDLFNYSGGGRHTCYIGEKFPGTNRTYVQHLADQMNAEGRRLVAAGVV